MVICKEDNITNTDSQTGLEHVKYIYKQTC